jgi:aryl-alcohol dehydrogenase-like predicted oxidoreductase
MNDRRIGYSGLTVSEVGIGCNNFGTRLDAAQTNAVVSAALDGGINLFDVADIYGRPRDPGVSERLLGAALRGRRDRAIVATKFGLPLTPADAREAGGSRRYIIRALEASLRRLGTEYVDLYQMHVPDDRTPLEETLRALHDLVAAGKVRYIGCSNFAGWQTIDADWIGRAGGARFICNQYQYSLLVRAAEVDVIPALRAKRMGLLPFFPLASGILTGKYRRGQAPPADTRLAKVAPLAARFLTDEHLATAEALEAFARERGHTLLELAFSWLLANDVTSSVIAGASTPEQVAANIAAASWALTPEDLAAIDAIAPPPATAALG